MFSKILKKSQHNYSDTDKELLGIINVRNTLTLPFRKPFILGTDHEAIQDLWPTTNMNSILLH